MSANTASLKRGISATNPSTEELTMRAYSLLSAVILLLASPASAQTGLEQMQSLARQLDRLSQRPAVAADQAAEKVAPTPRPIIGLVNGPKASADGVTAAADNPGWTAYRMSACIAFVTGSSQYVHVFLVGGGSFITQNSYALPIISANCASGGTFFLYVENDRTTVSAIASYPPGF